MQVPVIVRCRIPELLEKIGKTQIWLSGKTNIHESRISEIVNLKVKNPNLERLMLIAHTLKCNINELFEWKWEWRAWKE